MAAIKNFKVASVKKNQIKEANEEIEQVKKRIEHYMAEEDRYLAEVQQLHNGQKEYEQEQKEIKYNLAVSQYKFENEKLKQIKAYVVDLNGTRMENKGKYLDALNEQIISIEEQLKYIEAEYGLGEKREKDADADE